MERCICLNYDLFKLRLEHLQYETKVKQKARHQCRALSSNYRFFVKIFTSSIKSSTFNSQ